MANILEGIGSAIKGLLSKKENCSFDKNQLLNIIDSTLVTVEAALIPLAVDFDKIFKHDKKEDIAEFEAAHRAYLSGLHMHERVYFDLLKQAIPLFKIDLEQLRERFSEVFTEGTDPSEIKLDQLKASHAAIIGYIRSVDIVCNWFCFMVSLIPTEVGQHAPQYRLIFVKERAQQVGETVAYVMGRKKGRLLIDDVKQLGTDGRDVFLTSNGMTIDEYAHDTDYSKSIRGFMGTFKTYNPLYWVTDKYMTFWRWCYDDNKALREWMLAKVAMLTLKQQGVDSTDPEYERLAKIIQNYSNLIAQYDKKIADYENEA